MSRTYLPADVRTRIIDLMKEHKFSQKKLALSIGVHESTLGRFSQRNNRKTERRKCNPHCQDLQCVYGFYLGNDGDPRQKEL